MAAEAADTGLRNRRSVHALAIHPAGPLPSPARDSPQGSLPPVLPNSAPTFTASATEDSGWGAGGGEEEEDEGEGEDEDDEEDEEEEEEEEGLEEPDSEEGAAQGVPQPGRRVPGPARTVCILRPAPRQRQIGEGHMRKAHHRVPPYAPGVPEGLWTAANQRFEILQAGSRLKQREPAPASASEPLAQPPAAGAALSPESPATVPHGAGDAMPQPTAGIPASPVLPVSIGGAPPTMDVEYLDSDGRRRVVTTTVTTAARRRRAVEHGAAGMLAVLGKGLRQVDWLRDDLFQDEERTDAEETPRDSPKVGRLTMELAEAIAAASPSNADPAPMPPTAAAAAVIQPHPLFDEQWGLATTQTAEDLAEDTMGPLRLAPRTAQYPTEAAARCTLRHAAAPRCPPFSLTPPAEPPPNPSPAACPPWRPGKPAAAAPRRCRRLNRLRNVKSRWRPASLYDSVDWAALQPEVDAPPPPPAPPAVELSQTEEQALLQRRRPPGKFKVRALVVLRARNAAAKPAAASPPAAVVG
eukprot:TRINITY_DN70383_c0_g1_i1.p1 TRINITY_DN70383_c0_g1~~TRINITY_DN70383_c0_g1_i1.p1  ORF type:complete len:550 (+),score=82.28 TRINITY_DN70383_c0_g1_i1:76-1650(+)